MAGAVPVTPRGRILAGLAYATALFLAFPHPVGGRVVDGGLLAGWLAPACLVAGLRGLGPWRAAGLAFAAGLLAHAAIFHWIYVVTVVYGHAPVWAGVAAPLALAIYPALLTAGFGAGLAGLAGRGRAGPFALAALWTAGDHLRAFALTGFPWATLGYAQHGNAALLGLAPWTGVYGLSFVTVLAGAALADLVSGPRVGWPRREARAALGVVLVLHGLGALAALRDAAETDAATLRVAVLQGDIDQGVKWSPEWAERTLEHYEGLTRRAAAQGAAAILWPETAVPGSLTNRPELRERIAALARESQALLVVGGVGVVADGGTWRFYDSAFAFAPSGALLARYDKSHLVPFGEYVPLRALLGRFLGALARGIAPADVSAGPAPQGLALPHPGGSGVVTVGVPICYELLFPDLVRRFVRDGAEVLFAITNDAWYGRTGAPYQFLAMTAVRSAETGVWTARAANTGVSAIIDHRGRVRARTPIFQRDLLVADVPLRPAAAQRSFYVRHGDVFAGACWAALAVLAGLPRRVSNRESR